MQLQRRIILQVGIEEVALWYVPDKVAPGDFLLARGCRPEKGIVEFQMAGKGKNKCLSTSNSWLGCE